MERLSSQHGCFCAARDANGLLGETPTIEDADLYCRRRVGSSRRDCKYRMAGLLAGLDAGKSSASPRASKPAGRHRHEGIVDEFDPENRNENLIDPPAAVPTLWQTAPDGVKKAYFEQSVIDDFREHIGEHHRNFARYIILEGAYVKKLEQALAGVRDQLSGDDYLPLIKLIDDALAAKPAPGAHYDPPL